MVNTSVKGWKKERECRRILEEQGWVSVFKSIRWRYGTLDFAKLFDSVLVHPDSKEWLFISNKYDTSYSAKHKQDILDFKDKYSAPRQRYECWVWHRPKYVGRGKDKHFQQAKWEIISVV